MDACPEAPVLSPRGAVQDGHGRGRDHKVLLLHVCVVVMVGGCMEWVQAGHIHKQQSCVTSCRVGHNPLSIRLASNTGSFASAIAIKSNIVITQVI